MAKGSGGGVGGSGRGAGSGGTESGSGALLSSAARWEQSLSSAEVTALKSYQGLDHVEVNKYLRGEAPWPYKLKKGETPAIIQHMDAAIGRASLAKEITAWRGLNAPDLYRQLQAGSLRPGSTFTSKSYTSTSTSKNLAQRYLHFGKQPVLLRVELRRGAKAAYISRKGGTFSRNAENKELLLARGAKFKVKRASFQEINGQRVAVISVTADV